jgi:hypothetical protein
MRKLIGVHFNLHIELWWNMQKRRMGAYFGQYAAMCFTGVYGGLWVWMLHA